MIDVQVGPLGAFEEQFAFVPDGLVDHHRYVGHIRRQALGIGAVLGDDAVGIQGLGPEIMFQVEILLFEDRFHLGAEGVGFDQLDEADAPPRGLVLVSRADAAAGGADLLGALFSSRATSIVR